MITSRQILKSFFETGDRPTEAQFAALIDSLFHKSDGALITSHSFNPNGDVSIAFNDGNSLDFNIPQNVAISFVTGLQAALDLKVDKVTGQTLTDNNFTQGWIDTINNLVNFSQAFAGWNGDLSVLQITLFTPIDTAGTSVSETLNNLPAFTIAKGQLVRVLFYLHEPSDGLFSYLYKSQVFAAPAGGYGLGNPLSLDETNEVFSFRSTVSSSHTLLNNEFPLFDLDFSIISGQTRQYHKQETFNKKVYERVSTIDKSPVSNKALLFNDNFTGQWQQNTPISWDNGNIFKIASRINVLGTPNQTGNWSSILQLDNEDSLDPSILRGIYVALIQNAANTAYKIEISLIEVKNATHYKSWTFTSDDWIAEFDTKKEIDFDFSLLIDDFANELFTIDFKINKKLVTFDYLFTNTAYSGTHFPQNNIIGWNSYYNAHFEMDYLKYTINGETTNFNLDEEDHFPPMATNGVSMDIFPLNAGNRVIREIEDGSLYLRLKDGSLAATTFKKTITQDSTDLIEIGNDNPLFLTPPSENDFTIRKINKIVYLRGEWEPQADILIKASILAMVLPLGFRPQDDTIIEVENDSGVAGEMHFKNDGDVLIKATGGTWLSGTGLNLYPAINYLTRI